MSEKSFIVGANPSADVEGGAGRRGRGAVFGQALPAQEEMEKQTNAYLARS
jgi:hypothetical protein